MGSWIAFNHPRRLRISWLISHGSFASNNVCTECLTHPSVCDIRGENRKQRVIQTRITHLVDVPGATNAASANVVQRTDLSVFTYRQCDI